MRKNTIISNSVLSVVLKSTFILSAASLAISPFGAVVTQAAEQAPAALPFNFSFSEDGILHEAGNEKDTASPHWWLISGGELRLRNGIGSTITGDLPEDHRWRKAYAASQPVSTDGGTHPQNLFEIVTRNKWQDVCASVSFNILNENLDNSQNRYPWNGIHLYPAYIDSNNYYYASIRMDGMAVIKKKIDGRHFTLAAIKLLPGDYHKDSNPNLLPKGKWMAMKSSVQRLPNGEVRLTLAVDLDMNGSWNEVLSVTDNGRSFGGSAFASEGRVGIRSDFMDVEFDNFSITRMNQCALPTPPTYTAVQDSNNLIADSSWFYGSGTLEEAGSMSTSKSEYWWLNSGAYFFMEHNMGRTIRGPLPESDPWRKRYASSNSYDTDGGFYPQNLFRLITRSGMKDYVQEGYFRITRDNLSGSINRDAHNGILFFDRYQDGNNFYYVGLRVDGRAVIKKKVNGRYYTLALEKIFPGTYNRTSNPNLLPKNSWIGLRTEVRDNSDGSVSINLFMDNGKTGNWQLVADAKDNGTYGPPLKGEGHGGIRTDFMDVEFAEYSMKSLGTTTQSVTLASVTTEQSVPAPQTTVVENSYGNSGNPFHGKRLYVNPYSDPKKWADQHRNSRPGDAALMDKIANQSETQWYGDWNSNVYRDIKERVDTVTAAGSLPVIVIYNIPQRDCGSYSRGGSHNPDAYRSWIRSVADAIGSRKTVVIVEPDAIAGLDCLSRQDQETRYQLLRYAVDTLGNKANVDLYMDAGNPRWHSPEVTAERLKKAGIEKIRGFALNISNFITTEENIRYGERISALTGGKHFVIETSRNGLGPDPNSEWCNPWGRALGLPPTVNSGHRLVDALLWVKGPAGSDGECNGGPRAGIFWPEYALDLARRATW